MHDEVAVPEIPLPCPSERPDAAVVLYDGECGFCVAQAERLAKWDRDGRLAFLPIADPVVSDRYPDLDPDRLQKEMVVIDPEGNRRGGAEAVRYLSRRLPRLRWLAPLLHIPGSMPAWRLIYRAVARRRRWLGGKTSAGPCDEGACETG